MKNPERDEFKDIVDALEFESAELAAREIEFQIRVDSIDTHQFIDKITGEHFYSSTMKKYGEFVDASIDHQLKKEHDTPILSKNGATMRKGFLIGVHASSYILGVSAFDTSMPPEVHKILLSAWNKSEGRSDFTRLLLETGYNFYATGLGVEDDKLPETGLSYKTSPFTAVMDLTAKEHAMDAFEKGNLQAGLGLALFAAENTHKNNRS